MPLHSIEGLFDAGTDAEVRGEWAVLAEAGLPSQAGHEGSTNAPHVTLSAAASVPDVAEARVLRALAGMPPVPVQLGPLVVMGSRRRVLARLVVPTSDLLLLQHTVAAAMADAHDVPERVRPGRWTPHVTLARGLEPGQVGEALLALGRVRTLDGAIECVRRWDPSAGRTWRVGGIPTMGP